MNGHSSKFLWFWCMCATYCLQRVCRISGALCDTMRRHPACGRINGCCHQTMNTLFRFENQKVKRRWSPARFTAFLQGPVTPSMRGKTRPIKSVTQKVFLETKKNASRFEVNRDSYIDGRQFDSLHICKHV